MIATGSRPCRRTYQSRSCTSFIMGTSFVMFFIRTISLARALIRSISNIACGRYSTDGAGISGRTQCRPSLQGQAGAREPLPQPRPLQLLQSGHRADAEGGPLGGAGFLGTRPPSPSRGARPVRPPVPIIRVEPVSPACPRVARRLPPYKCRELSSRSRASSMKAFAQPPAVDGMSTGLPTLPSRRSRPATDQTSCH